MSQCSTRPTDLLFRAGWCVQRHSRSHPGSGALRCPKAAQVLGRRAVKTVVRLVAVASSSAGLVATASATAGSWFSATAAGRCSSG